MSGTQNKKSKIQEIQYVVFCSLLILTEIDSMQPL